VKGSGQPPGLIECAERGEEPTVGAQGLRADEVREVVEAATLAPSVHNTQPWRFSWDGSALSVYEDPSRALPVLDPAGRERLISCGAAVVHARLTIGCLGRACAVDLLPDPAQPELLARLEVGGEVEADEANDALALAIPRRYTDRGVFLDRPVPTDVVERLRVAAEREGAWVHPVERPGDKVRLAVLLSHALQVEEADPAYAAELQRWRTHERAEQGIPDAALGDEPVTARASDYALRDFDAGTGHGAGASDEPPPAEHPLAVVLGTLDDEREDWLVSGMAMGRLLLQATVDGLAASPLTQVVEVDRLRLRLRRELGLLGMPQVVLRLGYGRGAMTTRRRPVDQVLEFV
jgi:hypothetical protein